MEYYSKNFIARSQLNIGVFWCRCNCLHSLCTMGSDIVRYAIVSCLFMSVRLYVYCLQTGSGWYTNLIPSSSVMGDSGNCMMINRESLRSLQCSRSFQVICEFSGQPDIDRSGRSHVNTDLNIRHLVSGELRRKSTITINHHITVFKKLLKQNFA